METWRLITTWGAKPEFNMGLDEALLENVGAPPTLRFYTWKPDTLSLGYFQRLADVPGAERASCIVRRITGGGAIHHVRELTFSIACEDTHRLYQGPVADSYARIHAGIAAALAEVGLEALPRGDRALTSDREGTGMCFHHSTRFDLAWSGSKGVGSAQRRKAGRVLHHGSIKLGSSVLEGLVATFDGPACGMTPEGFAPILHGAFERVLDLRLVAGVPDPDERTRARELGQRYISHEFVHRH